MIGEFVQLGRYGLRRMRYWSFASRMKLLSQEAGIAGFVQADGAKRFVRLRVKRDGETYVVLLWPGQFCCPANTPIFGTRDPPDVLAMIERLNRQLSPTVLRIVRPDEGYCQVVARLYLGESYLNAELLRLIVNELVDAAHSMDRVFRQLGVPNE
jgi:hypothetical protein